MAKTKIKETVAKDLTELRKDLKSAKQDLSDLYLDHSQFKLKNTRQIFNKRKDIARISTIIRGKELSEAAAK